MRNQFLLRRLALLFCTLALTACSSVPPSNVKDNARLTPKTSISRALTQLPAPKEKIAVAVYGLRDQTGQYKSSPESPYSTEVTQGAASMLIEALRDSGWYLPVEREGLQNLLTERRIVRAIESPTDKGKPSVNLPNLMPASLIIEGGIIAYESNVRTGGKGASFLGIGAFTQYRVDQVTIGLRSVDLRSGQILTTVSVTKTIYSYQFDTNIYKFTNYQKLLQGETGFTTNEPGQLALKEAIEAAVVHLTVRGVRDRFLELKDERDWNSPIFQSYLKEGVANLANEAGDSELIPMTPLSKENQGKKLVSLDGQVAVPIQTPAPVISSAEALKDVPVSDPMAQKLKASSEGIKPLVVSEGVIVTPLPRATQPGLPNEQASVKPPVPMPSSAPAQAKSAKPNPKQKKELAKVAAGVPVIATGAFAASAVAVTAIKPASAVPPPAPAKMEKSVADPAVPKKPLPAGDIFNLYWGGKL